MGKNLIFTATYNEFENILEFLNKVFSLNLDLDVLIVDDNSPDLTWQIIEDYKKKQSKIKLIKGQKKRGWIQLISLVLIMQKETITIY